MNNNQLGFKDMALRHHGVGDEHLTIRINQTVFSKYVTTPQRQRNQVTASDNDIQTKYCHPF